MQSNNCVCPNCNKGFFRYKSQQRNGLVFCSRECKVDYFKKNNLCAGKLNSNYRTGNCCEDSYCKCGNVKDSRAKTCSICANVSFAKSGSKERFIDEKLIISKVNDFKSFVDLAKSVGYSRTTVKNVLVKNNIKFDHFNEFTTKESSLIYIFTLQKEGESFGNSKLKNIMIKYGFAENKCSECGIPNIYNGIPLTIQLHHIDGNRYNNKLDNLKMLCPNCHSQTHTFCGGNKGKYKQI
jgi:hypothetical protein